MKKKTMNTRKKKKETIGMFNSFGWEKNKSKKVFRIIAVAFCPAATQPYPTYSILYSLAGTVSFLFKLLFFFLFHSLSIPYAHTYTLPHTHTHSIDEYVWRGECCVELYGRRVDSRDSLAMCCRSSGSRSSAFRAGACVIITLH